MLPDGLDEATIKAAVAEAMGRRRSAVLVFVTVAAIAQIRVRHICKRPHGGSLKGRIPNRDIGRAAGEIQIHRDYFSRLPAHAGFTPTFDREFIRRYRIPRTVYERFRDGLLEMDDA
jgi:hypothetical protein